MAPKRRFPWLPLVLLLGLGGLGILGWRTLTRTSATDAPPLARVTRGPLRVTVLESGSLEALQSTTIASQVEGQNAILHLIEEGTVLTAEDVAKGRVLVRLDDSSLQERIDNQAIEVKAARAATVSAEQSLAIQVQEDASAERQATLKVEFAALDLKRYVGEALASELERARRRVLAGEQRLEELEQALRALLTDERLKGEAQQKVRQLKSDISLAEEDLKRAEVKWDWSKRLLEKDFVSRDEEDADRLAVERRRIELDRARTAYTQFETYDFGKQVTQLLSDLVEAEGELERVRDRAKAAQSRALAEVESRKEQQALKEARQQRFLQQRESTVIKATKPGLVLYASSVSGGGWNNDDRIREGVQVRERQPILTMPDADQMGARINVHESVVDRVKQGQPVTVTVDALPDQPLEGTVELVKTQPNPADRWMNPDLKVYTTLIRLKGLLPGMRPGMSVRCEILVNVVADAIQVPVQAVGGAAGKPRVWVYEGGRATERVVTVGASNDRFTEVLSGLVEGELVLLAPPRTAATPQGAGDGAASEPADAAGASRSPGPGGRGGANGPGQGAGAGRPEGAGRATPGEGAAGAPADGPAPEGGTQRPRRRGRAER
jgi:multidrug resistance efflux pump